MIFNNAEKIITQQNQKQKLSQPKNLKTKQTFQIRKPTSYGNPIEPAYRPLGLRLENWSCW